MGAPLLRRVIASFPAARQLVPQLRMIVIAGPRIDPATLPAAEGLEIRPYVHDLYRHLVACDLAIVQGGLTTAMELTANQRPFIYFPLKHHFEQMFTSATASNATELDGAWISTVPLRRALLPRSRRRSVATSTTAPSRPTEPRAAGLIAELL